MGSAVVVHDPIRPSASAIRKARAQTWPTRGPASRCESWPRGRIARSSVGEVLARPCGEDAVRMAANERLRVAARNRALSALRQRVNAQDLRFGAERAVGVGARVGVEQRERASRLLV